VHTGNDEHHRAPLLWLLAPYVAGLLLARAGWVPGVPIATAMAGVGVLAVVFAALRPESAPGRATWTCGLAAAALFGGAAWMQIALAHPARWLSLPQREASMTIDVERVFPPVRGIDRQSFTARIVAPPRLAPDLDGQRIHVSMTPRADDPEILRGTRVRLAGLLQPLRPDTIEAGTFESFLVDGGVRFRLTRGELLETVSPPGAFARLWHAGGRRLEEILRRGLPDTHPATHAVVAMFLGRKSELAEDQREAFLRSGTMHLFAISGLHIGVIATCLHTLLAIVRLPKWAGFVVGTLLLLAFVESTGGTPSARRALFMVTLLWAGHVLKRPANALASLCAAAFVVLLVNPLAVSSASFQMSYAVVAAILLYGIPLHARLRRVWRPFAHVPEEDMGRVRRAIRTVQEEIAGVFGVSVAASCVSLPLSVLVFGLGSPGAVVSNMLVMPGAALAVTAGFASIVSGLCGLALPSVLFNHAAAAVLWVLSGLARFAANLPGMYFEGTFAAPWVAACVVATVLAACVAGYAVRWRHGRLSLLLPPALATAAVVFLVTPTAPPPETAAMKSAYELAMERLAKSDPDASPKLTTEQKAQLADLDRVYQGKIAEREIFLKQRLAEAQAGGQRDEYEKILKQISGERARLEEEREDAKNRVRRAAAGN
jgi:competence protein ComEC